MRRILRDSAASWDNTHALDCSWFSSAEKLLNEAIRVSEFMKSGALGIVLDMGSDQAVAATGEHKPTDSSFVEKTPKSLKRTRSKELQRKGKKNALNAAGETLTSSSETTGESAVVATSITNSWDQASEVFIKENLEMQMITDFKRFNLLQETLKMDAPSPNQNLVEFVTRLHEIFTRFSSKFDQILSKRLVSRSTHNRLMELLKTHLISTLPDDFGNEFARIHEEAFTIMSQTRHQDEDAQQDTHNAHKDIPSHIHNLHNLISKMGLNCITHPLTFAFFEAHLESYIRRFEEDVKYYEGSLLSDSKSYLNRLRSVVEKIVGGDDSEKHGRNKVEEWMSKLTQSILHIVCQLRISSLFDMIIDYPESKTALMDLKETLPLTSLLPVLKSELDKTIRTRGLHVGVNTKDIVALYTECIKALRILDPSGGLTHHMTEPIKRYLRTREDTIRTVVQKLLGVGEDGEQLAQEEEEEDELAPKEDVEWEPLPIDANVEEVEQGRKGTTAILVNIYDSKDVFIKEFQQLLAQRLLAFSDDYNVDREIKQTEELKLLFGDVSLSQCEVMLKDVSDSRRIHREVSSTTTTPLHALIISKLFWPTLRTSEEKMILPSQVRNWTELYEKKYEGIRAGRKLAWLHWLGRMDMEIELDSGEVIELECSMVEGLVLQKFGEKDTWNFQDLTISTGLSPKVLRATLFHWISKKLLRETSKDVFEAVKQIEESKSSHQEEDIPEVISDSASSTSTLGNTEVIKTGVMMMLQTQGPKSQNGLFAALKMFGILPNESDEKQFAKFLEQLAKDGMLECVGGLWRKK